MVMNKSGQHRKRRDYRYALAFFSWPHGKDFLKEIEMANEIEKWCEENLEDDWTAANDGVFIYKETDAIAFKLRWI